MGNCKECGLPYPVCNALACYRDAIQEYRRGRTEIADRRAISAKEFYDEYFDRFKSGAPGQESR